MIFNLVDELLMIVVHLSSHSFSKHTNTLCELIELLNCFQHHTHCTSSYCQHKIRETDELTCCFHFFWLKQSLLEVFYKMNSNHQVYLFAWNDALLNNYNIIMIMKWMINTNLSFCMNQTIVMHYLIKYCFKIKKKSESFKSFFQFIMLKISDKVFLLFLTIKLMNKLIVKWNWSA